MKQGDKVYVRSFMYEGEATVMDVITGNIFPIQVELDEADSDGHRIKRFGYDEVTKL